MFLNFQYLLHTYTISLTVKCFCITPPCIFQFHEPAGRYSERQLHAENIAQRTYVAKITVTASDKSSTHVIKCQILNEIIHFIFRIHFLIQHLVREFLLSLSLLSNSLLKNGVLILQIQLVFLTNNISYYIKLDTIDNTIA